MAQTAHPVHDFDLLVVGCGPVGALAGNLAGAAGLSTLVIDSAATPHPLPRAVHLDHEMMRLFQAVGLAETIRPAMNETEGHLHVGADRGVIRYMGTAGRPKPFGWANDYFFYQPELKALLRGGLRDRNGVQVELDTELVGLEQDERSVTATLRTHKGGRKVRVRHLVACDGARSAARRLLGVQLDDLHFEQLWLVDVANLVSKLLAVKGGAPEELLDTYQPERDPHVRAVIDAAIAAGRYICELDLARAAARDAEMRARRPGGTAADLIPPLAAGAIARGTADDAGAGLIRRRDDLLGTARLATLQGA